MSGPVTARPAICLNMIVRNEVHVVSELLDSVASYIGSWVIVDTGSDDGTQDLINNHMARLGIPGELHERPWRDFGHNRTEALALAQGHGDYIWVLDADDLLVGTPDFTRLDADIYVMRHRAASSEGSPLINWRAQLFRDGLRVRYQGVIHEAAVWDDSCVVERLEGEYHIEYRHRGARSRDPQRFAGDRDLLLAAVERNPEDAHSVLHLAQAYFNQGDFANARKWYARRVELGGPDEAVFYAMFQVAESMAHLGEPWPDIQDAYLRAWGFRPIRAEPLYAIALRYRAEQRYRLGYQFAKLAAEIPMPEYETYFSSDVYAWRAAEEQAICAGMIGKHAEAFRVLRRLLARPDLPDDDRQRIGANRDIFVQAMIDAAAAYPEAVVGRLLAGPRGTEVAVSLVAGPDRASTEQALNSFLACCLDVARVGHFLVLDAGLSARDRAMLAERYGFLEFADPGPGAQLARIRAHIDGRFWLHLGQGWRFFAPESLITRLTAVLQAEEQVFQVGVNLADAVQLTGTCAAEQAVRRAPAAGRYVLTDAVASGPAMFDTARLDQAGRRTASLDEVLCIAPAAQPISVRSAQPDTSEEMSTGNDGPIFVVGAGRSGTTLMRVMLDSHPRICCGPELKLLSPIARLYQMASGPFDSVMNNYGNTLTDMRRFFRAFIEELVANYRRASGKPRWAEKTPQNVRYMVPLGEIFPEARFIHMLRDGRDVACSLVTMNWVDPATGRKADYVATMTAAARFWRDTVMGARQQAAHPSLIGRVLEVRYEELVTETAVTMRQVLAFLGEEWDEAVLSHHTEDHRYDPTESSMEQLQKPVNQGSLGRWQRDMAQRDKATFKAEAGALLTELGYAGADW